MQSADTRFRLIRLMSDGAFHSGQRLADELGISRSAVWKQLQKLRDATGLKFDAVKGKGYRLGTPVELFRETLIRQKMQPATAALISDFHIHDSIDSSNTWLMKQAAAGATAGGHFHAMPFTTLVVSPLLLHHVVCTLRNAPRLPILASTLARTPDA